MSCPVICPREQVSNDEVSPGPIDADESILRAVFPSDRGTQGIKRSVIPRSQLWEGRLSVWRLSQRVGFSVEQLVAMLEPRAVRGNGETFDQLRACHASTLREFQVNNARAVCLVDECTIDTEGNKHPAHAHIAICEVLRKSITRGDDTVIAIQEGLKLLFEPTTVWQRAN
jgi:hypothetical protein